MEQTDLTIMALDQDEANIRTIHLLRGAIITAYSLVEFLLADLYFRARCLQEYSHLPRKLPYKLETKIKKLKAVADLPGPISQYRQELHVAAEGILQFEKVRHFMVHGLMIDGKDDAGISQIIFRGYVEIGGEPTLEILRGDMRLLEKHLQMIEIYSMKFVTLAHEIIDCCKLPQIG